MKRPAFQFYPADFRNSSNLRRCSWEARGVWIELICLLHDAEEYGVLRWPLKEIAQALGCPLKALKELVDKGVLKGGEASHQHFIFTPVHAGKPGEPVTLVEGGNGPCWYSSRMVRDEYVRTKRGIGTRFGASDYGENPTPKPPFGVEPKAKPKPPFGDGPSSSSSSSIEIQKLSSPAEKPADDSPVPKNPEPLVAKKPDDCPHEAIITLYHEHLPTCPQVRLWTERRKSLLRSRWREAKERQSLDWWKGFFEYVSQSNFLTGQAQGAQGRDPFVSDLEWLLTPSNFVKVIEGKYHGVREAVAA